MDHSAGLNCGIWDYSAFFVNKFGDHSKYVITEKLFQTCYRRGAQATGGVAALLLPQDRDSYRAALVNITRQGPILHSHLI
uniref:Uncharacterized protein n=1 Tax=Hucho hucho TaxID=62062 RepID=A0A4W5NA60_9TELE